MSLIASADRFLTPGAPRRDHRPDATALTGFAFEAKTQLAGVLPGKPGVRSD